MHEQHEHSRPGPEGSGRPHAGGPSRFGGKKAVVGFLVLAVAGTILIAAYSALENDGPSEAPVSTMQVSEELPPAPPSPLTGDHVLHEFGDVDRVVRGRISGALTGGAFAVSGADAPRDAALLGIGWAASVGANAEMVLSYDAIVGSGFLQNDIALTLR